MKKDFKIRLVIGVITFIIVVSIFGYLKYTETNGIFIGQLYSYERYEDGSINITLLGCDRTRIECNHSKVFDECWITDEALHKFMGENIVISYYVKGEHRIAKHIDLDKNKY